jgi:hypothetical protein
MFEHDLKTIMGNCNDLLIQMFVHPGSIDRQFNHSVKGSFVGQDGNQIFLALQVFCYYLAHLVVCFF